MWSENGDDKKKKLLFQYGAASRKITTWTPAQLGASLLGWWNADRSDLITLNGSQVTSWKDIVAGINLTQATAGSRPLFSTSSFNGSAGVTFDGVDDFLDIASVPFPTAGTPSEIWGLVDQTALVADTTTRIVLAYGGDFSLTQRILYRSVVSGQSRATAISGNNSSGVSISYTGVNFDGRHVGRATISSSQVNVGLDAGLAAGTASVAATGANRVRMGASANVAGGSYWQGTMREVIVTGALSAPNAALLNAYLASRKNP